MLPGEVVLAETPPLVSPCSEGLFPTAPVTLFDDVMLADDVGNPEDMSGVVSFGGVGGKLNRWELDVKLLGNELAT